MGNKKSTTAGPSEAAEVAYLEQHLTPEYKQRLLDNSGSPPCENLEDYLDELYNGCKPKGIKGFLNEFPSGRIPEKEFVVRLTTENHGKNEQFWKDIFKEFDTDNKGLSLSQLMMAKQKIALNA